MIHKIKPDLKIAYQKSEEKSPQKGHGLNFNPKSDEQSHQSPFTKS